MSMLAWFRGWNVRFSARSAAHRLQQQRYLEKWKELPEHLRTPQQVAGIRAVACGATHSLMEKCNFACTSCYLSESANHTRPLPFDEAKSQLEALRRYLGPGGKVQITSGEVTLLPVDELGRIVAYARKIGLDPMVMTNGQRLLQIPEYLPTLVVKYGLEKLGLHIDTTQKGRPGMRLGLREEALHPIRDRFARLLEEVKKQTRRRLHAAHTVTVTPHNLDDIPQVVRWVLDHLDTFRLISFLPVAEVGRTQDRRSPDLILERVWEKVCAGVGHPLNRHAMHFGHPQCNITAPLLVVSFGRCHHLVEVVRADHQWDLRTFQRALWEFSAYADLDAGLVRNFLKFFWPLLRHPGVLAEFIAYGCYRLWSLRSWLGSFLLHLATGRPVQVRPLLIVVHQFMSPHELDTPLGRERLAACVFKVPVGNSMVSMCQMNGTGLRRALNLQQLNGSARAGR